MKTTGIGGYSPYALGFERGAKKALRVESSLVWTCLPLRGLLFTIDSECSKCATQQLIESTHPWIVAKSLIASSGPRFRTALRDVTEMMRNKVRMKIWLGLLDIPGDMK